MVATRLATQVYRRHQPLVNQMTLKTLVSGLLVLAELLQNDDSFYLNLHPLIQKKVSQETLSSWVSDGTFFARNLASWMDFLEIPGWILSQEFRTGSAL